MDVDVIVVPETAHEHATIETRRVDDAVSRVADELARCGEHAGTVQMREQRAMLRDAVLAQSGDSMVVLHLKDILMARVEDGRVTLHTAKQTFRSAQRLYELETRLGTGFVRLSKSVLVNLDAIERIEPGFGGSVSVRLTNGTVEWISRRCLRGFKAALGM